MKLLVATHNVHKITEITKMLPEVEILTLNDFNDNDEVAETGATFSENAALKAQYYYQKYQIPVIADDSGLVVDALNGEPGIYSARYAATGRYEDNNKLLLKKMTNIHNRQAFFITVICFIDDQGEKHYFTGTITGIITESLKGTAGFGYDPLFFVPQLNQTFAEMSLVEKNKISHRALALNQFKVYIQKTILENQ